MSRTQEPTFVPLAGYRELAAFEMIRRARDMAQELRRRRSVRHFSSRPFPEEVLRACLEAAGSAPSGANRQPWHFVVVRDPLLKRRIREGAEAEEREFYRRRAPAEWLRALAPLGTDEHKPFLEEAPCLVLVFAEMHAVDPDGAVVKNDYVNESVGIATGFLIAALHHAGLACLTHTPSPMSFLNEIVGRPPHERPYLVLVVGHPAADAQVPVLTKKSLEEIATFV